MDYYEEVEVVKERILSEYDTDNLSTTDRLELANELRDLYLDKVLGLDQICYLASGLGEEMSECDMYDICDYLNEFRERPLKYIALSLVTGYSFDEIEEEGYSLKSIISVAGPTMKRIAINAARLYGSDLELVAGN